MKYIKLFEQHNYYLLDDIFENPHSSIPDIKNFYLYTQTENLSIDDAIDSLPIVKIDIDKLTPTKARLSKSEVDNVLIKDFNENELPFIFLDNGIYYIIDGHHRITYYKLHNINVTFVRLFITN